MKPLPLAQPHFLKPHQYILKVRMDGCMGNVRGDERWAQVVAIAHKKNYGDYAERPYALVQYIDDGTTQYLVAEERYWVRNGRVWEYQY